MDVSEPKLDVIQQDYDEGPAPLASITVPVRTDGPVLVHHLPTRSSTSRYINTALGVVSEVAPFDLRREYLIVTTTQAVYLGHDKQLVSMGETGQIPAGVMVTLPTSAPVYCMPVTTAGILSWWAGQWSE